MSTEYLLRLKAPDETTEFTVFDAKQNPVFTVPGRDAVTRLSAGLYKVLIRLGPAVQERLVALDEDQTIEVSASDLPFATPVPLRNTARTRPYHEQAAIEASRMAGISWGKGATILVFARDWTPKEDSTGNPLLGLSLRELDGGQELDLTRGADFRQAGDVSAGNLVSVDPGAYVLRLTLANGQAYDRVITATRGWQTQLFLFRRDYGDVGKPADPRANLADGPVVMAGGPMGPALFNPEGQGERAAVLARYALVQRRPVAEAVYQDLLRLKFQDPVLGLLVAHLLRRDKPDEKSLLDTVMANLHELLGPDHPDVQALEVALGTTRARPTGVVVPPMLRAGWDRLIEASVIDPNIVPDNKLFDCVQAAVLPSAPWLIWRSDEAAQRVTGDRPPLFLSDSAREALRSFVVAHLRSGQGKSGPPQDGMWTLQTPELASGKVGFAPVNAFAYLAGDTKVELARSLGVSGTRLYAMVSRALDDKTDSNETNGLNSV